MTPTIWTDEFLDRMRQTGDPPADDVVKVLFDSGGIYRVWELMKTLVENDAPTPQQLPAELKDYLAATSAIPQSDPSITAGGQRLFAAYGAEILLVLACYSLPASYAARKGVQVLYRTGYLNNRANHRLFETTQMVMDTMVPGGLQAGGRGVRTAQKVRLLHAATRRLILHDPERVWPDEFGTPINQEDLAGTLMVFTHLILEGLERLGIAAPEEDRQGYLETWKVIARLMGIQEALIPADVAQAKTLCDRIQERQVEPCEEGRAMTRALLEMMEHKQPPGPWRRWPAALMRFFLPPAVADGLAIPQHDFEQHLLEHAADFRKELESVAGVAGRTLWLVHKFALSFIQCMVSLELGGKRTPFVIPTSLHHGWAAAHRAGVWEQLRK